ncbi:flagellar protein FlaG [Lysinibacillus fusiformis]
MRISTQDTSMDMTSSVSNTKVKTNTSQRTVTQEAAKPKIVSQTKKVDAHAMTEGIEKTEINKEKLQKAIDSINEFMEDNMPIPTASKFKLHEDLDRYYVQVVDPQTDEVVKEIPPKKLLDAFYEMQKMLGMIVDEKI